MDDAGFHACMAAGEFVELGLPGIGLKPNVIGSLGLLALKHKYNVN